MTIASSVSRNNYVGNGNVLTYSYTFKIFNEEDLLVTIKSPSEVETVLSLVTDYTVEGVGNTGGGTIIFVNNEQSWVDIDGHLLSGYALTIRRVVDVLQSTDIRNQGAFFPETHENHFDYQLMISQQQQDELNRSIKAPETDTAAIGLLPSAADRANTFLGFDSGGDPIPAAGVTSVPVSTFMATVLDDTSASAALTTLGVSTFAKTILDDTTALATRGTLQITEVTLIQYGAIGDGSTNDTAAVQAAIDSGAGIINTGNDYLTYKVTALVGRSNLKLIGNGTFNFSANGSYATSVLAPLFLFQGSAGSAVLLTANAASGATTLTVASTTGLAAGDLIELATPTHNGGFVDSSTTVANGELLEIQSVDSSTALTLRSVVLDLNGYTTANTAQIRKITPIENVDIGKDITFIGKGRPQPSGSGDHGIVVLYGRNINISGKIRDIDLRSVYLHGCYKFKVQDMEIIHPVKGTSSEANYGISCAGSSTYGEVSGNRLVNMRHGFVSSHISTGIGTFYGVSRVVSINNNTCVNNWHAGLATHNDAELVEFRNNTVINSAFGINVRDRRAIVSDNTLIKNTQHILLSARANSVFIYGNKCYEGGYMVLESTDSGVDIDDISIISNHGYSSKGIDFTPAAPASTHDRLCIKDNVIRNDPGEGGNSASIRVEGAITSVDISNNSIFVNANGNGIRVAAITNGFVGSNTVRNVSAIAYTYVNTVVNTYAKQNSAKGYGTYQSGSTNLVNTATYSTDNTDMGA